MSFPVVSRLAFPLCGALILWAGCSGSDGAQGAGGPGPAAAPPPAASGEGDEQSGARAGSGPGETAEATQGDAAGEVKVESLELRRVDVSQAEDGRGEVSFAIDPIALELHVPRWPESARDPVLHVGALRFELYSHPSPTVLRYVAANASDLPEGEEVVLQYGDGDAPSRIVVTGSLEVP